MATIAEKIEGSDRLERRVNELIQMESNPQTAWAPLDGDRMNTIHGDLWPAFLKNTFQMLVTYKDKSEVLRQQQAPAPSNQAAVPTYLPWQQQQWQPQPVPQQTQAAGFTHIQQSTPRTLMLLPIDFSLSNLSNLFGPQAPSFADQLKAAEWKGGTQGGAQGGQGLTYAAEQWRKLAGLLLLMLARLLLLLGVAGLFKLLLLLTIDMAFKMRVVME